MEGISTEVLSLKCNSIQVRMLTVVPRIGDALCGSAIQVSMLAVVILMDTQRTHLTVVP